MSITVLIAEDDSDMRLVIKKVVEEIEGVEVIGEAGDGLAAIKLIEELAPQVVFVDIDIPGKNGVELAQEIFDINPWIFIVFATAFSEYRSEAFDVYAFDYLVKPFKLNRLRQTMERIKAVAEGKLAGKQVPGLSQNTVGLKKTCLFKINNEFVYLELDGIIFITKEARKTIIYHKEGVFKTNESLSSLEKQLQGYQFFRSHKGFIVNLNMVKKVTRYSRDSFEIAMSHTDKKPLLTWENAKKLGIVTNSKI
ncbi:MAG: LytTR family DNA-binding domain-containing protein [Desulfotomaculaceae bacterium]|nr:LytTR family DNA-binding domain-containing protein [Desulfotomaculaceae bacterium]